MSDIYLWAIFVYEAARLEAQAARRPIVPEPWGLRDLAFREQFERTIARICVLGYETTAEAEHASWVRAYEEMGWRYGPVRDPIAKTHPDMVPFEELTLLEQQKDAVFLALCDIARAAIAGKESET